MAVDIGARIKVDGEAAYNQQISQIIKQQKELKADMQATSAAFAADATNKQKSAEKTKQLERQLASANDKLKLQKDELARLEASGQGASKQADNLRLSIARTEAEIAKLNKELRENSGMVALGKDLQEAGQKLQTIGGTMTKFGTTMTKSVTAPLAAAGAMAIKLATEFETAMAKLNSIADTSEKSLDTLRKEVLELSNDTGIAASELAEQTYQAISAGQSTANSVKFVEQTTKLARAGFAETGNALDVLTTIINAYGKSSNEAASISDKLILTQNLGKTTVGQLSENMGQAIPTAAAYSVNLDNISSAYVTLTKQGINTANATTQINGLINQLGKAGTTSAKALKEKTGKTFKELMEDGADLADVLGIVAEAADENGLSLNDMFGNIRAGRAAMAIMNDQGQTFKNTMDAMGKSAGTADKAFQKVTNTTAYKFEVALNKVKNTGIDAGQQLLITLAPAIEKVGNAITKALDKWESLSRAEQQAIIKTAMFAAAIGPATTALGGLTTGIGKVTEGAGKLLEKWGLLGQIPIGGVVGIAAAFVGLSTVLATISIEMEKYSGEIGAVNRESQKTQEATKEVTDAVASSADAYKQSASEMESNEKKANKLVAQIESLRDKSNKTAADERNLAAAVANLNEIYPGLNLTIDENTGKLSQNTSELKNNVKNLAEQAKAVAAQERLIEINKQLLDVEAQRTRQTEQIKEATEALTTARNNYNVAQENGSDMGSTVYYEAAKQLGGLRDGMRDLNSQEAMLREEQDMLNAKLGESNIYLDGTATSADGVATSYSAIADSEQEAAAEAEAAAEKIMEAAQLQVSAFEQVAEVQTKGIDEIIAGLQSQITAQENYRSNVNKLQQYVAQDASGNWDEVVRIFSEGGISMAGELQGVVDAIESGDTDALAALADLTTGIQSETVASGSALVNLANTTGREMQKVPPKISAVAPQARAAGTKVGDATATAVTTAMRSKRGQAESAGAYITDGLVKGLNSRAAAVNAAASNVANIAIRQMRSVPQVSSPSKVTTKIGEYIAEGLAVGMMNNLGMVKKDATQLANAAIPEVGNNYVELYGTAGAFEAGSATVAKQIAQSALSPELIYDAMVQALDTADLTVVIGEREFGRILRKQGAL